MRLISRFVALAVCGVLFTLSGCGQQAEDKSPAPVASNPGGEASASSQTPTTQPSAKQQNETQQPEDSGTAGSPPKTSQAQPQASGPHPTTPAAKKLLDQMVAAYRAAGNFADEGHIRMKYVENGEQFDRVIAEFGTVFQRPNKLRVQYYTGVMVSDGQQLVAQINGDELGLTGLNDQVLVIEAPQKLTLEAIYSDRFWLELMTSQIGGSNPQIAFLLAEDPLGEVMTGASPPRFGEATKIENRPCQRVVIPNPDGNLVLCIDEQTFELRRVELPVEGIKQQLDPNNQVTGLSINAEFAKAKLDGELPADSFAIEIPEGVTMMRQFVPINRPEPPSELLGKKLDGYAFETLDGQEISPKTLEGKVAIFDFWATWCGPCRQSLPNLERVYQKYQNNPNVQIYAVAIDDGEEAEDLKKAFAEMKINIPIARPKDAAWLQAVGVVSIPQLFLVDDQGTLQEIEIGFNDKLAEDLPRKIDEMRAGKKLYFAEQELFEKKKTEYQRILHESSVDGPLKDVAADGFARIPTASDPARLKLDKLWTCEDLKSPGNVYAVRDPKTGKVEKLLVHEDWKSVAEVGLDGKVAGVHQLDVGAEGIVSYLRTATDKENKRYYLASAQAQQRVHLFDENWKLLWHHPEGENKGIGDADFADLDADGVPEVVIGYLDVVGLHGVSLEGKRIWSNKSLEYITSVVVTNPGAEHPGGIVCTNAQGVLVALDKQGQTVRQIAVGPPQQPYIFRHLTAFDLNGDGKLEYCGLSISAAKRDVAVGVSNDGRELWRYPLPAGMHRQPVELVSAGPLPGQDQGCWVLAGANGSLHFLSADGTPIDQFRYGAVLTGVALFQDNGRNILVVSSVTEEAGYKLEAWQVSAPAVAEKKDAEAK